MDEQHRDDNKRRRQLADILWDPYPGKGETALLNPTDTFPEGSLLGPYRLDPLDPNRRDGPPVDLLGHDPADGDSPDVDRYEPIRRQLAERALQAAVLSDRLLNQLLERIEVRWCHGWDQPWQVIGLAATRALAGLAAGHDLDELDRAYAAGTPFETVTAVPLVPAGEGHPGDALHGLIAPPVVFGLILVNEGYEKDDDGRRIGEIRMQLVVLADGRWGLRHTRRNDSPWQPQRDSTLVGTPVTAADLAARDKGGFTTDSFDALAGVLPETLARVLQVAVEPDIDPHETLLRLLAAAAVNVLPRRSPSGDLARIDPATVAYTGTAVIDLLERQTATTGSPDQASAVRAMRAIVEGLHRKARDNDGDWLDDDQLRRITRDHALHAAAGAYRAVEHVDDTTAAWLGSQLMAARAGELAGPVTASLATIGRNNPATAQRLARIVEHRRNIWQVTSDDALTLGVTMAFGDAVGRNAPCPCRSGRKYKHCCLRATDT